MARPLILLFMRQIRFDCHGLAISYGRSDAAKKIVSDPAANFPLVRDFLYKLPPPTDELERDERVALAMLLSDMGARLGYATFSGVSLAKTGEVLKWAYEQSRPQSVSQAAHPN